MKYCIDCKHFSEIHNSDEYVDGFYCKNWSGDDVIYYLEGKEQACRAYKRRWYLFWREK